MSSRAPLGALAATGEAIGSAPSLADLRRHSVERRRSLGAGRRASTASALGMPGSPLIAERKSEDVRGVDTLMVAAERPGTPDAANGGSEDDDEKPGCWAVTVSGLKAFWKFFTTWTGFLVTIYMLNGASPSNPFSSSRKLMIHK
jgi:hypothetical protein